MSLEKHRDENITGGSGVERTYRIELVTAAIGNWIINQITSGKSGDLEVYDKICNYLFEKCYVYDPIHRPGPDGKTQMEMRIYAAGQWLKPELDLEYDTDAVNQLFEKAVDFNCGPTLRKILSNVQKAKQEVEASALARIKEPKHH